MVGVSINGSKKVPLNKWLNYVSRYHLILISYLINSTVLIQPINKIYKHCTIDALENVTI